MALNTLNCNHLTPLGLKGLNTLQQCSTRMPYVDTVAKSRDWSMIGTAWIITFYNYQHAEGSAYTSPSITYSLTGCQSLDTEQEGKIPSLRQVKCTATGNQ